MDVLTLLSLAAMLRKTTEDPEPVSVQREASHWRITDGRHRAIAALIAGRVDVLAKETAMVDARGDQARSALDH
jgi:hypothetical protein